MGNPTHSSVERLKRCTGVYVLWINLRKLGDEVRGRNHDDDVGDDKNDNV